MEDSKREIKTVAVSKRALQLVLSLACVLVTLVFIDVYLDWTQRPAVDVFKEGPAPSANCKDDSQLCVDGVRYDIHCKDDVYVQLINEYEEDGEKRVQHLHATLKNVCKALSALAIGQQ